MVAKIEVRGGVTALIINGTYVSEMAYITYRPEYNRYSDFEKAGVRLFSVNLNFSEMPLNEYAPVLVFQKGIFEGDEPDFSIVDRNFDQILNACPDAYIFPRVNVNLPRKWEEGHPDELCEKGYGERTRFSFASDIWANDVKKYLSDLIYYIENSKYKDRVIGYQLAAGNTEEWLAIDPQAGYGLRAKEKFELYCKERKLDMNEENYYLFMSETVASRIEEMSRLVKELTGHKKLVGCFYGYTLFVDRNNCHNALERLLECESLDFLCSPLTYADVRAPGIDLYPMIPIASLRQHNKLYFSENDIRTHLSTAIHDHPNYTLPIWYGHDQETVCEQMKLAFCRAMLYGYGMWWFDMWGGWYADDSYMELIERMSVLFKDGMDRPDVDIAVFVDEKSICRSHDASILIKDTVRSLGLCGAPYDAYLASDFDDVYRHYKACVFIVPAETPLADTCIKIAEETSMPRIIIRKEAPTAAELRSDLKALGIDISIEREAVVYRSERYISLYTGEAGEYDFCDRGMQSFTELFDGTKITFPTVLPKGKLLLFERK